jgi:hypothetical protein
MLAFLGACSSPPPAGFAKDFEAAVENLRSSAAYSLRYEIRDGDRVVRGVGERFRGDVLKVKRDGVRFLRIGGKTWSLPEGGGTWDVESRAEIVTWMEDPAEVVGRLRGAAPVWVGRETVGEFECAVVQAPMGAVTATVWYHREGVERIAIPSATWTVTGARSSLRLMADDEPAPWSDEMKSAAVKAVEEKKRGWRC